MRLKSLFTVLSLMVLALLIWWFHLAEDHPINLLSRENPHFLDAYMRDFQLTVMNADGKPDYTLHAHKFDHYNDEDVATLQLPVIDMKHGNAKWQLSAQDGKINDTQNKIVLYNKVVMQQFSVQPGTNKLDQPGVRLRTERLNIDTGKQIATSNQLTLIDYKNVSMRAHGMRLDNLTGQLELLAKVTGVYAAP